MSEGSGCVERFLCVLFAKVVKINLKAAKQIGVTIPPSVLARADRVIR